MPRYDDYVNELEAAKRVAPDGGEYWMARAIQPILDYKTWENFTDLVARAMEACAAAGVSVEDQFRETTKMIEIGKGGRRATR